jgi:hypothetical protein
MEKIFKGYLILNWRSGVFRVVKRMTSKAKETEIPIEINLKVKLPEQQKMKVEGEIELSGVSCKKIILDALDSGEFKK